MSRGTNGLFWSTTWAFGLEPVGNAATKPIVRWRSDYRSTLTGRLANRYPLEPVHFLMEPKMLLGVKARPSGSRSLARSGDR